MHWSNDERVMDIGCGSGDVTRLILMLIKFKLTLSSASILKQIFNSVNDDTNINGVMLI